MGMWKLKRELRRVAHQSAELAADPIDYLWRSHFLMSIREKHEEHLLDDDLRCRDGLIWRRGAPCDVGLYDAGQAQIGHLSYVFGGFLSLEKVSNRVRIFDLKTETWLPSLAAPPGLPQSHVAIAGDGLRFVYCASGQLGPQCSPAIRDVFSFDTATGGWRNLPPLPTASYAGTAQLWRGRLHFIGGAKEDRYTPSSDHWSIGVQDGGATEAGWRVETPIPVAGMHRGSIIHQDALYVIGGQQGDFVAIKGDPACTCTGRTQETYLSELFRLDTPTGEWTRLADLPIPASHTDFSVIEAAGRILLVGGQIYKDPSTFQLRLTDAIQSYDVERDHWSLAGQLPYRLKFPLVTRWNDTIFVSGGQRGVALSDSPGPITRDVWAAPLSGLHQSQVKLSSKVFAGKSVLMVSHELSYTGAPLLLVETAQRLIEAGATVRLASLGGDTAGWTIAARLGVPVIPIETAAAHAAASDIVIANTVARPVMTWVSEMLRHHPAIADKLVCWVHEMDAERYMPEAEALTRASLTIFDSQACRDVWLKNLGSLRQGCVIHPYVNSTILSALSRDRLPFPRKANIFASADNKAASREDIRQALGVGENDLLVLNLARCDERKGQKLLLSTLAQLVAEKQLPVKLLLVGFGDKGRREDFLEQMNARERAVLTADRAYLWQTDIAAFYRAADVFVMNTQGMACSKGECFGRTTVEAMAAGNVVLGTAAGGTADIIIDGETGFLYPTGPEGQAVLADRIEMLVNRRELSATLSRAGQLRAATAFSQTRFFQEFEACVEGWSQAKQQTSTSHAA